jgi:hypothetical protein
MDMVKRTADETDISLSHYILKGVTEGLSYDKINAVVNVPCCKDVYYKMYRRFFWLLNRVRE